jgi:hypothetical protein
LHWKVARRTLALNRKLADSLAVSPDGPDLIEVSGAAPAAGAADARIAPVTMTTAGNRYPVTAADRIHC